MGRTHFLYKDNIIVIEKKMNKYYDHMLEVLRNSDPDPEDIIEYSEMLKDMEMIKCREFFIKLSTDLMEKLRYKSVIFDNEKIHTDICVVINVMNIIFKYMFDLDCSSSKYNCCNYETNLKFQYSILRDASFKILELQGEECQNDVF